MLDVQTCPNGALVQMQLCNFSMWKNVVCVCVMCVFLTVRMRRKLYYISEILVELALSMGVLVTTLAQHMSPMSLQSAQPSTLYNVFTMLLIPVTL